MLRLADDGIDSPYKICSRHRGLFLILVIKF